MPRDFMPKLKIVVISLALLCQLPVLAADKTPALHQLSNPQIRLLKALQTPVAVPGYLPKGCKLDKLTITYEKSGVGGGPGYELLYNCYPNSFTLRAATGGFGGPSGDKEETIWNPVFGKIPLLLFLPGGQMDTKTPYYYTDWIGKGPLYFSVISGADDDSPQLPLPEARKVIQALTYLR